MRRKLTPTGVFYSVVLMLAPVSPAGADAPVAAGAAPVKLSPFVTRARAVGSFGFSVIAQRDGLTQKVVQLTIQEVARNSEAERKGLGPLTRILGIDGRDIQEFTASFAKGSDLNMKLMDRKKGDRIALEVVPLGARSPKRVVLTEGLQFLTADPHDSGAQDLAPGAVHLNVSRDPPASN